jgi:thiamine-monophosphate kinase
VTGALGGSGAGRHLRFEPRLPEGRALLGWAGACMDVSDGLGSDLRTLMAASRAGCILDADHIPLAPDVRQLPHAEALRHALCDGEDFELLFTVPAARCDAFMGMWSAAGLTPASRIGMVTPVGSDTAGGSVLLRDRAGGLRPMAEHGYEHFHV